MPRGIYLRTKIHCKRISLANKGRVFSLTHKLKLREGKLGEKHPRWKGGKRISREGYILILVRNHPYITNDGYMFEHRLVMEKHIGRYLLPSEIVHHINGIKTDNRIENLELTTRKIHTKNHSKARKILRNKKGKFIKLMRHHG